MFYTELHGDFLHWIVMREIHRGATLYFFVSSLRFYGHGCDDDGVFVVLCRSEG